MNGHSGEVPLPEAALDARDALYLRRAIALSARAGERGNRPFGAVVALADGTLAAEAGNDTFESADCTGHAETNALRLATPAHPRAALAGATMYASGEPCVMCAGAIFWSGIRRVVFGIDAVALRRFRVLRADAGDLELSCREVFAASPAPFEVIGPALLDEATAPHTAFWSAAIGSEPAPPRDPGNAPGAAPAPGTTSPPTPAGI